MALVAPAPVVPILADGSSGLRRSSTVLAWKVALTVSV